MISLPAKRSIEIYWVARVRTYAVVPLLPDLGALEWVRDTFGA